MNAPLISKPSLTAAIPLKDADVKTVKWVQTQLFVAGYLDEEGIDGIVGDKTLGAFAAFKKDFYLEHPTDIGPTTVEILDDVEGEHEVEDHPDTSPSVNPNAGQRTGRSATLPKVGLIFENEMVFPGTYITWGEMTKGLSRLPVGTSEFGNSDQIVNNMIELAKVFGQVRTKFGSPIAINSAYRPPNLAIGARRSQHKFGRALDVRPLNGDYSELLNVIKAVPEIKGIGLAGPNRGFWHIDTRPSQRVLFNY